ncbi:YsnF/AvaK domain-containing protein [Bernardetia sp. Wsw4-3y2]|uniref:YsnF/AvaK domain-containing protein n=1 Tax=Bernardetia sp. Wsw4-3y2 TaxID=3127471 RepID=UPI0030CF77F4
MSNTVIGIFRTGEEAQYAANQLMKNGIEANDIDLSARPAGKDYTYDDDYHNENAITRFFENLFGDDEDEKRKAMYCDVAARNSLLTVHADSKEEAAQALTVLNNCGAIDIESDYEYYQKAISDDHTDYSLEHYNKYRDNGYANVEGEQSAKVIKEEMHVGKRDTETGRGARLRSYLVEKPVEETVRLRVEHVYVEREPVNRPATEADFANFKESEIEVTEHAEKAVVSKDARVVEEVRLGKTAEERQETIKDTVRETKVEVEEVTADGETRRV